MLCPLSFPCCELYSRLFPELSKTGILTRKNKKIKWIINNQSQPAMVLIQISLLPVKGAWRHILTNASPLTVTGWSVFGCLSRLAILAIVMKNGILRCKVGDRPLEHLFSTCKGLSSQGHLWWGSAGPWRWSLQVLHSPYALVLIVLNTVIPDV